MQHCVGVLILFLGNVSQLLKLIPPISSEVEKLLYIQDKEVMGMTLLSHIDNIYLGYLITENIIWE